MKQLSREEPEIVAAVERRIHAWALSNELGDKAVNRQLHGAEEEPLRYIVLSREAGIDALEIANIVGQRLGWDVYDKNLLDCIAQRFNVSRIMLDLVDETRSNWVYDVLGTWMDRKLVPHEKFVAYLTRILLSLIRNKKAVIVGRGAQFILPREALLAVRLVASPKYRIARIMAQNGVSESEARYQMEEIDRGRREFVERFFRHDVTDPHFYDLVINVERCGTNVAAEEIIAAALKRNQRCG